ncbi:hypothetical protein [Amycolatopsis sp. MEPSY49]|uniref:hypothetical protein n=1 Tax=Amycolatopsis sp. MEPSY49 TaxID=3151600 RepID=UPI003EF08F47
MDRPSQEPPEPPGSPLSFPVEAPKVAGVEPGAGSPPDGEPLGFPAEAGRPPELGSPAGPLGFPAEAARSPELGSPADPLAFPAEAARSPQLGASAGPLGFPSQPPPPQPPPATPLPFPVAQLPGTAPTAAQPAHAQPEAAPTPETRAPRLLRFLPPALTAAAALLATGGLFFPLFRLQQHVSVRQRVFEARLTVTQTAWGSRIEIPGQEAVDQGAAPVGIPVILAVLLLAVAAFTAFARSRRGRWLIGAGAFFTGGVVVTVGMIGPGWSAMADGLDFEVVTTAGMWLLIGAAAAAAAAAVIAALPGKTRDWADPTLAYADTPTPPSGVAITVLPPEQQPG